MAGNEVLDEKSCWRKGDLIIRFAVESDFEELKALPHNKPLPDDHIIAEIINDNTIVVIHRGKIISEGRFNGTYLAFIGTVEDEQRKQHKLFPAIAAILFSLGKVGETQKKVVWATDLSTTFREKIIEFYKRISTDLGLQISVTRDKVHREWGHINFKTDDATDFNQKVIDFLTNNLGWRKEQLPK